MQEKWQKQEYFEYPGRGILCYGGSLITPNEELRSEEYRAFELSSPSDLFV